MDRHSTVLWESEIADVFQAEARSLSEPEPSPFPTPEHWLNYMTDATSHQTTARSREAMAAQSLADGDWWQYMWLVPKNLRSRALWLIQDQLSDAEYWKLLGDVWICGEFSHSDKVLWLALFSSPRPERRCLMSAEELAVFASLPDPFRIYRGVLDFRPRRGTRAATDPRCARGMAWTLSEEKARWFAERFLQPGGVVYAADLPKRNAFAYFAGRDEQEIVIDPRRMKLAHSYICQGGAVEQGAGA